jgi:hypothetical protein
MEELITKLSTIVPTYPFEGAQGVKAPYATYELSETPIRTKDGIVGSEGTLTLSVYAPSLRATQELADAIVSAIDSKRFGNRKVYYADTENSDYPDVGLSSKTLTFNTLS